MAKAPAYVGGAGTMLATCALLLPGAAQVPSSDATRIDLPASEEAVLAFEVASVRPAAPDEPSRGFGLNPQTGRVRARNQTLRTLIAMAYGPFPLPLPDDRMRGGPDWIDDARFTIEAIAPAAALQGDVIRQMSWRGP